jgi:hypothetical protein
MIAQVSDEVPAVLCVQVSDNLELGRLEGVTVFVVLGAQQQMLLHFVDHFLVKRCQQTLAHFSGHFVVLFLDLDVQRVDQVLEQFLQDIRTVSAT